MKTLRAAGAALIALAIASPAAAQSSGSSPGRAASAGAVMAPLNQWAPPKGGGAHNPGGPGGGMGWNGGDGPHDRDRWLKRCLKRGPCGNLGFGGYHGSGGFLYDPVIAAGLFGYFGQGGDAPRASNGSARFDYDRGYPYDHYSAAPAEMEEETPQYSDRRRECMLEPVRDRRSGGETYVRICRN